MTYDMASITAMAQSEMDELFRQSPAGDIPAGEAVGTAIIAPGTIISDTIAHFVHIFAWKGKVFDPATGTLRNIILPIDDRAIMAQVYKQASWFDGAESIVLDYSRTSIVAHWVRDEIRLIAPQTYLGIVFWDHDKLINFMLQFPIASS
jgi:hypothetical protein